MTEPSVLILEPESSGLELVGAAAALGFTAHLFDRRRLRDMPRVVRDAVATGRATFRRVEIRSAPAVTEAALELAAQSELAAVVPGFEYAVPTAAVVAWKLGLPGLHPEAAEALRDKGRMKERLTAAGVPVAPGALVDARRSGERELEAVAGRIGFPAVVKPVDGSGSLGVRRADDYGTLRRHIALAAGGPTDDMGKLVGERLLVEAYVAGPEFSVEGYAGPAGVTVVAVTEKQLGPEPWFVEVGHVVQAALSAADRESLEATARSAVRALGLTCGVFHLEARLGSQGPVVLEVAARLGGDRIPRLVAAVDGHELPRTMIRLLAGLPVAPPDTSQVAPPDTGRTADAARTADAGPVAAARFLTAAEPARLADPGRLARQLRALPGCLEADVTAPPGATVLPARDFRQRFGHLVATAPDRRSLDAVLDEADRLVGAALERPRPSQPRPSRLAANDRPRSTS
ncbi:ATP-grasp domain-containing protein [Actinacidiphila sp. ITFR-21]|uniref:ATP-grasp domain-containing protein n=1 Tax=Actinacidiphila sp. ITFR-21 TaxID=3075199 RepID=UPI002889324E|nr:ATP-grasp domain-containing protein [Streptomyces sp. ITFR-21]WNI18652.1 ATP-grasp domain-containing protein [Streptomyces sp. ITFR-21]